MSQLIFTYHIVPKGCELRLNSESTSFFGKKRAESVYQKKWLKQKDLPAISALARLETACDDPTDESCVLDDGDGYYISDATVAALSEAQARSIGLPASIPYQLRLSTNGPIIAQKTVVSALWHKGSGQRQEMSESGAIAHDGYQDFRIPESLYAVLNAVDALNEWNGEDLDIRLDLISQLKVLLSHYTDADIDLDLQVSSLNLMHASAVSIDIQLANSSIDVDPILFSKQEGFGPHVEAPLSEDMQLVPPGLQETFKSQFRSAVTNQSTYVLERNVYVFVDPALRPAMEVIKEAQSLSVEARAFFAKSPQSFLKQKLLDRGFDDEVADEIVDSTFVETDRFSERVMEVGLWQPPVFPFIQRVKNSWIPEGFGIKIGSKSYSIPETALRTVTEAVAESIDEGRASVLIPGTDTNLPASKEVFDALNTLIEKGLNEAPVAAMTLADAEEGQEVIDEPRVKPGKSILRVQDNFLEENFSAQFTPRSEFVEYEIPRGFLNTPKEHQEAGISWLQKCWNLGYPGVLLADDMGLGKTFQTLAFMSWLFEKRSLLGIPNRPVLIIAPTTLLGNWQREAALHIDTQYIGATTLLYGAGIKTLRLPGFNSNDVVSGRQTLDVDQLLDADWVLTTYETMRDYHISLASVPFAAVVFDEMQKIKNPQSMMTHAAQSLNSDFSIGLTGTPIENSLADLWTLFDTLMPGAMGWGDLRQFLSEHSLENPAALRELKQSLQEDTYERPAPMLRRMKVDVAKDLPPKNEHLVDITMPPPQADPYEAAVKLGKQAETGQEKMVAFQRIRGVSLHAFYPGSEQAEDGDDYVAQSARLIAVVALLDKIKAKGEKALVFIETIAMHEWLAFYLQKRFEMPYKPERIFGGVSSMERAAIVDRFQDPAKEGQFDLLLLSPKAAGVGLTLTAATNVIHLSRWWNPAVEDQCTDRAYRIGQKNPVNVYVPRAIHPLYGGASFDVILHDLLESKRALSQEMLVPMETGREMDQMYAAMSAEEN